MHAWSLVLQGRPRTDAVDAIGPVVRHEVTFADLDQGMEVAIMRTTYGSSSDEFSQSDVL